MSFKRLKYGTMTSIKGIRNSETGTIEALDNSKFRPSEVMSKYVEISIGDLTADGKLPDIMLTCGTSVIKQLYTSTFAVAFHPALKLGTVFIEVDLSKPDLNLFGMELATVKVDVKRAVDLSYVCRIYQLDNLVT